MIDLTERKDIFLDFMGPDMWKTFSTFGGSEKNRINVLSKSLNVAVLMTKDYCILPPAFIAQSHITQYAMQQKSDFLDAKLILFPLKESSLEHYFEKKQAEYKYVKDSHFELYKKGGQTFIHKYADAIIFRKASMGTTIAENWLNIPDESELWKPIILGEYKKADSLRKIPTILKDRGNSVTLEAVKKLANIEHRNIDLAINQAIQHEYLKTYLEEYSTVIIEDIPPKPINLNYLIEVESIFYNYFLFTQVLGIFEIDKYIENASASTIISIRRSVEFSDFIELIWEVCYFFEKKNLVIKYFRKIKQKIMGKNIEYPFRYNIWGLHNNQFKCFISLLGCILDENVNISCDKDIFQQYNEKKECILVKEKKIMNDKVFIVHGHNKEVRDDVELFVRQIGLDPIILAERVSEGKTVIEKIESYSDVHCAIVLYTGCDEGRLKGETKLNDRARQNVVFEHGYMVAKLGREKVIALVDNEVEIPGDLSGVIYISRQDSEWKIIVMKELKKSGLDVNLMQL